MFDSSEIPRSRSVSYITFPLMTCSDKNSSPPRRTPNVIPGRTQSAYDLSRPDAKSTTCTTGFGSDRGESARTCAIFGDAALQSAAHIRVLTTRVRRSRLPGGLLNRCIDEVLCAGFVHLPRSSRSIVRLETSKCSNFRLAIERPHLSPQIVRNRTSLRPASANMAGILPRPGLEASPYCLRFASRSHAQTRPPTPTAREHQLMRTRRPSKSLTCPVSSVRGLSSRDHGPDRPTYEALPPAGDSNRTVSNLEA